MKNLLAGLFFLLFSSIAYSGVIIQPVDAIASGGSAGLGWLPVNAINQSGLSVGYTSGVTDFDTYMATSPVHDPVDSGNTWFSLSNQVVGYFDLDLGGTFYIESLALWNEGQAAGQGVNSFALYGGTDPTFASAVHLGNFNATDGLNTPEVFGFTPTMMSYLRIEILSNHGGAFVGIMEVAVEQADSALYGTVHSDNTLVRIDLPSYAFTTVGPLGTDVNYGGLAFDSNTGIMYMAGGRGNNNIYTVDYTTGAATLLGAHGIPDVFGLAYDTTNNVLYGATFSGNFELYSFSQVDGSATLIGPTGISVDGLAYDSLRDRLIAITASGSNTISELNRTNGSATPLQGGPWTNNTGLTYDLIGDVFYSYGLAGTLYQYSATDFTATQLASGLPGVDGLTFAVGAAPVQLADLTISKLDSPDPVMAGTELTYTIRVDNIGDAVAENVVVTDNLPSGLTLVSTTGCAEDPGGAPTCSLGTIDAGGFAQYTMTVTVDPSVLGLLANTATVVTSSTESDDTNNSATAETTVNAEADLSITKMDSSDPFIAGGNQMLTYTIEVSNAGPSDATNVVVTDTLSPLVRSHTTSGCVNDPNGVPDCQLGTIPAGGSAIYTITVDLSRAGGLMTNVVSVMSDASDPVGDNDTVEEVTEVIPISIPTLNHLGLLVLILLVGGIGWVSMRRI